MRTETAVRKQSIVTWLTRRSSAHSAVDRTAQRNMLGSTAGSKRRKCPPLLQAQQEVLERGGGPRRLLRGLTKQRLERAPDQNTQKYTEKYIEHSERHKKR